MAIETMGTYDDAMDKCEGERKDLPPPERERTIDEIHAEKVQELARKIAAMPLETQLRLSVMVNEGLPLTLDHAREHLARMLPGVDFKLAVDTWSWNDTVLDEKRRVERTWTLFWFTKPERDCKSVTAKSFDELLEKFAKQDMPEASADVGF